MVNVSVEGLDEYRKKLESLDGNFKKALKSGVMKGSRKVATDANTNAKNRGWRMGKYYHASEAKSTRKSDSAVIGKVGTKSVKLGSAPAKNRMAYYKEQGDYFHVKFPEFGTVKQSPKPTLQPALESNQEYVKKCVVDALKDAIKKTGF